MDNEHDGEARMATLKPMSQTEVERLIGIRRDALNYIAALETWLGVHGITLDGGPRSWDGTKWARQQGPGFLEIGG